MSADQVKDRATGATRNDAEPAAGASKVTLWHGIKTVTALELRQRVRSKRWLVALGVWFVVIGLLYALIHWSVTTTTHQGQLEPTAAGSTIFGLIVSLVLGLGLVVAPAFTATSINGERTSGTLALLQATRLSALSIAAGKLLAAWLTSAVFLVAALPYIIAALVIGDISPARALLTLLALFFELAVVCAIGLGWSALTNRTSGSTVLTYLTVVGLTFVLPLVMLLGTQLTRSTDRVRVWGLSPEVENSYRSTVDAAYTEADPSKAPNVPAPPIEKCTWNETHQARYHPEKLAWLLYPNPLTLLADAPTVTLSAAEQRDPVRRSNDPLLFVSRALRDAALPQPNEQDACLPLYANSPAYTVDYDTQGNVLSVTTASGQPVPVKSPVRHAAAEGPAAWPWSLAFNLALGSLMFGLAVRRLTVPYGRLPKGTRVA